MKRRILLQPAAGDLPDDFSTLRSDAVSEGYRFIERLVDEWNAGSVIFDKPGEALLIARCDNAIAGVGGVTVDPSDQAALRMRRFYVRPKFRRHGVARELAGVLIADALRTGRRLNVNAGTETAAVFWQTMGFRLSPSSHHTHVWGQASSA